MNIGVFDSGIGGQAIAEALETLLPSATITTVDDHRNMPYGNKTSDEIINLTDKAIQPLIEVGCDIIVIACNTATTVAIDSLRTRYPGVNFVGIEPMIKPAALNTKTGRIAVCATAGTLKSDRYLKLKEAWTKNIEVIEPDCSNWAEMIENGQADKIEVEKLVEDLINNQVDTVVLGCTHYHWLKSRFQKAGGPDITVLEPTDAIAERINNFSQTADLQHR